MCTHRLDSALCLLGPQAVTSGGDTPLHTAAYHGQEWAIDTLLRLGANRRAINDNQQRPLQVARHNTARSMLQPSMTPGGRESAAVYAGAIEAECWAGRPQDLEGADVLHISRTRERDFPTGDSFSGVQGEAERGRVREEVGRFSVGAMSLDEDNRRQHGILGRKQGNTLPSTKENSDYSAEAENFDRMINSSSFVSSLVSTETEEDGNAPFVKGGGDPVFEEGSSEGEFSQDSAGDL